MFLENQKCLTKRNPFLLSVTGRWRYFRWVGRAPAAMREIFRCATALRPALSLMLINLTQRRAAVETSR